MFFVDHRIWNANIFGRVSVTLYCHFGGCLLGRYSIGLFFVVACTVARGSFHNPESGDSYQIDKSKEAFMNGGFIGAGPGQGTVKNQVPRHSF